MNITSFSLQKGQYISKGVRPLKLKNFEIFKLVADLFKALPGKINYCLLLKSKNSNSLFLESKFTLGKVSVSFTFRIFYWKVKTAIFSFHEE